MNQVLLHSCIVLLRDHNSQLDPENSSVDGMLGADALQTAEGFCQDDAAAVSALFWDVLTTSEPEAERRRSMALDQSCLPFASAVTRQGQERQQCVIPAYELQDEQQEVCIVVPAKCLCTADRKITRQPSAVRLQVVYACCRSGTCAATCTLLIYVVIFIPDVHGQSTAGATLAGTVS